MTKVELIEKLNDVPDGATVMLQLSAPVSYPESATCVIEDELAGVVYTPDHGYFVILCDDTTLEE